MGGGGGLNVQCGREAYQELAAGLFFGRNAVHCASHWFKFPEGNPFFTSRRVTKLADKAITCGDRTQD